MQYCDENTIGVAAVLGSTFDGSYEPVKEIAAALDQLQQETGLDIPIHVDGASGGFVAPFLHPDLEWDFRVKRVQSINASGHKYGLVYPGVGWVVWRDEDALPQDLIFDVNYLGGHMPTFTLNFSRPGSEVVAQYFMFTSLGFDGYRRVQQRSSDIARYLAAAIGQLRSTGWSVTAAISPCSRWRLIRPSPTTRCSTCPTAFRERAGWCRPTPSHPTGRTWRCYEWWSGRG